MATADLRDTDVDRFKAMSAEEKKAIAAICSNAPEALYPNEEAAEYLWEIGMRVGQYCKVREIMPHEWHLYIRKVLYLLRCDLRRRRSGRSKLCLSGSRNIGCDPLQFIEDHREATAAIDDQDEYEFVQSKVPQEDWDQLLAQHIGGVTVEEDARSCGVSKSTIDRKRARSLSAARRALNVVC